MSSIIFKNKELSEAMIVDKTKENFNDKSTPEFEKQSGILKKKIDKLYKSRLSSLQKNNIKELDYLLDSIIDEYLSNLCPSPFNQISSFDNAHSKELFKFSDIVDELSNNIYTKLDDKVLLNISFSLGSYIGKKVYGNKYLLLKVLRNTINYFVFNKQEDPKDPPFLKITLVSAKDNKIKVGFAISRNKFCTSKYANDSYININDFISKNSEGISNFQDANLNLINLATNVIGMHSFIAESKTLSDLAINFVHEFEIFEEKQVDKNLNKVSTKGNILIVEDSIFNQKMLSSIVSSCGYDVFIAKDGGEAIAFSMFEKYDLILMDLNIPIMNGIEVAKNIKKIGNLNTETPIILQTTNSSEGIRFGAKENFIANISKPYIISQIKNTIAKYTTNTSANLLVSTH